MLRNLLPVRARWTFKQELAIPCDEVFDMGKIRCYRNAKSRHLTDVDRIKKGFSEVAGV